MSYHDLACAQVGSLVLPLQRQTNNVAEYCGLIVGLEVRLPWHCCNLKTRSRAKVHWVRFGMVLLINGASGNDC